MQRNGIYFNSKKAFTLLEVIISITIFMIVLLFLYKTLDQTKHSNSLFATKDKDILKLNHLNNIILEDIAESIDNVKVSFDDDKNARVIMKSNNSYHNPYFNNIVYLISSNGKFVRIESLNKFEFENTNYEFYDNSFIDVLLEDIEFFDYSNDSFVIKQNNKDKIVIRAFKLK